MEIITPVSLFLLVVAGIAAGIFLDAAHPMLGVDPVKRGVVAGWYAGVIGTFFNLGRVIETSMEGTALQAQRTTTAAFLWIAFSVVLGITVYALARWRP